MEYNPLQFTIFEVSITIAICICMDINIDIPFSLGSLALLNYFFLLKPGTLSSSRDG